MALLWTFSTYAVLIITLHGPSGSALPLDERDHTEESLLHYADDPVLEASDEAEGSSDGVPADRDDSTNYLGTDDVNSRSTETSINLCCRRGYQWTWDGCVELEEPAHIPSLAIFDSLLLNQSHLNVNIVSEYQNGSFRIIEQHPCHESYQQFPYDEEEFKVLDNGSIYTIYRRIIDSDSYCISSNATSYIAVQCMDLRSYGRLDFIANVVSVLCLIATFFVYSVLPKLNNTHGKILRIYVALMVAGRTLKISEEIFLIDVAAFLESSICNYNVIATYFLATATWIWLNVMCFDIWRAFRTIRISQHHVKDQGRKRFVTYSISAWGLSFLMTGVYLLVNLVPEIMSENPTKGCADGFYDEDANKFFMALPLACTMMVNICLFGLTAWKIYQYEKSIFNEFDRIGSKRHRDNKSRFNVYLRLFVMMGMNQALQWLCYRSPVLLPVWIYTLAMWINLLDGVWVFIISICTNNIICSFIKRCQCPRSIFCLKI